MTAKCLFLNLTSDSISNKTEISTKQKQQLETIVQTKFVLKLLTRLPKQSKQIINTKKNQLQLQKKSIRK